MKVRVVRAPDFVRSRRSHLKAGNYGGRRTPSWTDALVGADEREVPFAEVAVITAESDEVLGKRKRNTNGLAKGDTLTHYRLKVRVGDAVGVTYAYV